MGESTRAGDLWHHHNFRRLWIGETVSQFGSAVSGIALPLIALLTLNASTLQVGLLATFESVAWLLVGLPSGAWVDRMRLRNLCSSIVSALIYVLLARELHLAAGFIGLLNAAPAVGGFAGSLVASQLAKRFGQGPTIWVSAVLFAAPTLVLPFVHRDWTLALMVAAQTVLWGACVVYNITQVSFRQALCPPELMGRMNATIRFLVWGTMPLGALLGGVLGSTLGVRETILIGAIGGLLAPLAVILSPLRTMRELPSAVPAAAVAGTIAAPGQ